MLLDDCRWIGFSIYTFCIVTVGTSQFFHTDCHGFKPSSSLPACTNYITQKFIFRVNLIDLCMVFFLFLFFVLPHHRCHFISTKEFKEFLSMSWPHPSTTHLYSSNDFARITNRKCQFKSLCFTNRNPEWGHQKCKEGWRLEGNNGICVFKMLSSILT